jgi:hypothetical protein
MKRRKSMFIPIVMIMMVAAIIFYLSIDKIDYQKDFDEPENICPQKECEINLCQPSNQLQLNYIDVSCALSKIICNCEIYNYDAFYQGLGNDKNFYNPSANLYKSYSIVLKDVGKKMSTEPVRLKVNFIEGKTQSYSRGVISVWPNDKYGQYHELLHFLIRSYTQPQEGWYPHLEEGLAHYGAFCYNNPTAVRCDYTLGSGNYEDPGICFPNNGTCKGQVMSTSLILELRRDYKCDWNHCWKKFLNWTVHDMKGKPLNLKDAVTELNMITGKDISPLLLKYGLDTTTIKEVPSFSVYYDDSVIEEEIINNNGEFTTI